ncbi:hypothetical protein KY330_03810 [Candidatus Woesearchaeota archaeon]|nr:hypothetical protein [Candidatus Woesearchaeota archaeon]
MRKKNSKHDSLVDLILKDPELVGLSDVVTARTEVACYDNGATICIPDIVFYGDGLKAIVEVKSSAHERCIKKLKEQLKRGFHYFLKKYGERYRTIGAYLSNGKLKTIEYFFKGDKNGKS